MASFGYTIPQVVVDWFAVMAFPLQKSFTLVACNLAELCFWTTLPLLQDWSTAVTFHTKCSKAEKDAEIVIHLMPLALVKLVP
jgi:hypothetical protein